MADYTVQGAAISSHEGIGCGSAMSAAVGATVSGVAIGSHEAVGCGGADVLAINYVTGKSISAHDCVGCPQTLGLSPDARIIKWEETDLVYSVWTDEGPLNLDNATVEWVTNTITKSTDDYSVITFGNTLVVHLIPMDLACGIESYTATITTADGVYTMSGRIIESVAVMRLS